MKAGATLYRQNVVYGQLVGSKDRGYEGELKPPVSARHPPPPKISAQGTFSSPSLRIILIQNTSLFLVTSLDTVRINPLSY